MDDGESHKQVIRQLWDRAVPHFEVTNLLEILKQDIFEAPFTCHDFYRHNKKIYWQIFYIFEDVKVF